MSSVACPARRRSGALVAAAVAAALVAGCGSDSGTTGNAKPPPGVSKSKFPALLADAAKVTKADFEPARGRTLSQIANAQAKSQAQLGFASSVIEPGPNRLAFGVLDSQNNFLYGRSAIYVARTQNSPARGPFVAPADTLVTKPAFRSQTAASESDPIAAIYSANVSFKKPGKQVVLVLTKTPQGTSGALAPITVKNSALPKVGQPMPPVDTETVADAGGNEASIDTRIPPAPELHQQHLKDVLGKKPVVLLIATPQLCQSRVCGPVVDIELQMKAEFGDKVAFIHQEVYKDNQVSKGLRDPLLQLHLETEPWLFAIRKDGTIAARIEGSFGVKTFRQAVRAALR